jgi:hypothetical protein
VSEVTPDPVFDKLARFTPSVSSLDAAEVLFRAGQASAPTPWCWKIAVVGSVLVIAALLGERLANNSNTNSDSWDGVPVIVVVPVPIPPPNPSPSPIPSEPESPWRLGAFLHTTDPDDLPKSPVLAGLSSADPPLTPRSREID